MLNNFFLKFVRLCEICEYVSKCISIIVCVFVNYMHVNDSVWFSMNGEIILKKVKINELQQ